MRDSYNQQPDDLYLSIARIEGATTGVAFLVEKFDEPHNGVYGLWLSCTHVTGERGDFTALVSQNSNRPLFDVPISLKIEKYYPETAEDMVLLYADEPLPKYLMPLMTLGESLSKNNEAIAYGFPTDSQVHGTLVENIVVKDVRSRNNLDNPQITLNHNNITWGFSGSPIWDCRLKAVIGIIMEVPQSNDLGYNPFSAFPFLLLVKNSLNFD